jgi:hypothetical protein
MSDKKNVYISADFDEKSGDREVADLLNAWGQDDKHKVSFADTAKVAKGSVSQDPDCRPCDLKREFNGQINVSSVVIFIVGDKTADRTAGSVCPRYKQGCWVSNGCTPYKGNANGQKSCKYYSTISAGEDVGSINTYSYLRHEFEQAKKKNKKIIILYNSFYKQTSWLPSYMNGYEDCGHAFWKWNPSGNKVGDYEYIKMELGF